MTPIPSCYDYWSRNLPISTKIQIDCLMPNGIIVTLVVSSDAILSDVKDELWDKARKYPLQGLLKEQSLYNFVCINSMAENEELVNENRRICDIKPFYNTLKVVECKGDKAEQIFNAHIGHLIGKGLHDFDSLKSLEVNDFRFRMKTMVTNLNNEKLNLSIQDKIKNHYPCDVADGEELPSFLIPKLCDGNMIVSVQVENVETSLPPFSIAHTTRPFQLLAMALQKYAMLTGQYPFSPNPDIASDFILKLCGRQEYLIGDYAISRFLCVRELLAKEMLPSFTIIPIEKVFEPDNPYSELYDFEKTRNLSVRNSTTSTLKKKSKTLLSWKVDDYFSFRLDTVSCLNYDESEVGIQAGIFHSGRSLCEPKKTGHKHAMDGESVWNEDLVFDIRVRDLPRAARLCIVIYALSKISKGTKSRRVKGIEQEMYINPIAWVNTTIFDYKSELKRGSFTLYMWTYAEDVQNDEIMNPLGTVVSNPNLDHATALTVTFKMYNETMSIAYPPMDVVQEVASQMKPTNSEELPIRSSWCLNGDSASQISSPMDGRPIRGAALAYSEQLRYTAERDPMHEMHEQEKKFLWSLRYEIPQQIPILLPKLLLCIEWNDYKEVAEMLSLLQQWPKMPPSRALELLDFAYADAAVRSYAVDCIRLMNDDELLLYLLQLVQALKHESHLECDLVDFLLTRALNNRKIGHFLFWHLRSEMHVSAVSVRFGLMLEAYCRGAPDHMKLLIRQMESLSKLKEISEMARQRKENRDKIKLLVQESLKENHCLEALSNILCPLDPALLCKQIHISKCKTMDSKMKPMWIVFENADPFGQDINFIFKNGDDLRQDMLTLQMIRIMDRLWKNAGLDLKMNPYGCISTGNRVGLIEVVLNADTIANIQKEKGTAFKKESLLVWLKEHNPSESSLNSAIEHFSLSCAGYCVATYVLGIADRHSDNVMVRKNGQLFHIDFGHILGHFKEKFGIRRERVPFVLTRDFVHVITKGGTSKSHHKGEPTEFEIFRRNCEQAFLTLRRHGSFIVSLFAMMISTGLPELSSEKDLDYLRETLVLDLSEQEALRQFRSKFDEALKNSWKTSVNWFIHNIATNNRQ